MYNVAETLLIWCKKQSLTHKHHFIIDNLFLFFFFPTGLKFFDSTLISYIKETV